jgi:hypothetical protein
LTVGAGEGAAFVTEEFAFDKTVRDRTAVDDNERSIRATAQAVNHSGGHAFSRAAFAMDQDGPTAFGSFP